MRHSLGVATVTLAAALAAAAGPAHAAVRYAAPSGTDTGDCLDASDPCTIQRAFSQVQDDDELVLAPGTYTHTGELGTARTGVDVHGAPGRPRPLLELTASSAGVWVPAGGRLADVRISLTGTMPSGGGEPIGVYVRPGAVAERIEVAARSTTAVAGAYVDGGTLRNSIVHADGEAVTTAVQAYGASTVRGVTAIASGGSQQSAALLARVASPTDVDVANSILRAYGAGSDYSADAVFHELAVPGGVDLRVKLRRSNVRTIETVGGAATLSVSELQTAEPRFADAAAGDFRQAPGSPTIDAGLPASDATFGTTDVDGDARTVGAAPDIGADEWVPPPAVPAPPPAPAGAPVPAPAPQPAPSFGLPPVMRALSVARDQRGRVRGTLRTGLPDTRLTFRLTVRSRGRTITIGRLTRTVRRAGRVRFTVSLTRAGKRRLRRARRLGATLRVTARAPGRSAISRTTRVRLRR